MDGRKICSEMDNPIDNIMITLCEPIASELYRISPKITPNMITSVGMIIGLACIYALYKKRYITAFILYWICYFFDCLDGYYARKYNMVTKFGDYFDHFRDIFVSGAVIYLLYINMNTTKRDVYVITMIVFTIGMLTHFGAQELNSVSPEHNDCLRMLTPLCKHKDHITFTRYAGCGTFILVVSLFILAQEFKSK